MSKYFIKTNQNRCIGCKACEVHCQAKNRLTPDMKFGQLISVGPLRRKGLPKILSMFMPCFHCEKPWCVSSCPTGAMTRRDEDGIIYVQEELCVGCKACIIACPWKVPQWDDASGRAYKCDFCMDRVDQGLNPACVAGCTAHALDFKRPNVASRETREEYGKGVLMNRLKDR